MTQYLVAIHHPDDYDRSVEDDAMIRDIDALNEEMKPLASGSSPAACSRPPPRDRSGRAAAR